MGFSAGFSLMQGGSKKTPLFCDFLPEKRHRKTAFLGSIAYRKRGAYPLFWGFLCFLAPDGGNVVRI